MEKEANEKAARIEKRFVETEERIVAAHKKHTDLLESQIQTLETQLDDKEKRLKIEEKLGDYHDMLMKRVSAIKLMGHAEYSKKNEITFWKNLFDPDTRGRSVKTKTPIVGMIQRGGEVRAQVVDRVTM